jgi:hypothetical protein
VESQEFFKDILEHRAKRLVNLIEMDNKRLISQEIVLIVEAAMGFCPDEVSKSMMVWISTLVSRGEEDIVRYKPQKLQDKDVT